MEINHAFGWLGEVYRAEVIGCYFLSTDYNNSLPLYLTHTVCSLECAKCMNTGTYCVLEVKIERFHSCNKQFCS